jgi:hypothetical protein
MEFFSLQGFHAYRSFDAGIASGAHFDIEAWKPAEHGSDRIERFG